MFFKPNKVTFVNILLTTDSDSFWPDNNKLQR